MNATLKKTLCLLLTAVMALALASCGGTAPKTYANGSVTLSIPAAFSERLIVTVPQGGDELFRVQEKKSVEEAKKQGYNDAHAGWLFSIRKTDEATLNEMLCYDMSGDDPFAKSEDGYYFLFSHPTDVTLVRESYENLGEGMDGWTELNDWAWGSVREKFIAENGLIPDARTNTDLDMYLAQIYNNKDVNYVVSATQYGVMYPNGADVKEIVAELREGATIAYADGVEAPSGEYIVFSVPEDEVRFDFFTASGKENLVREVWKNGNDALFRITYENGKTNATAIMRKWYNALVETGVNVELGYTPDSLVGTWAEKTAGRGAIKIEKAEGGTYLVQIRWGNSAAQYNYWVMQATPGNGGELHYENCKMSVLTFSDSETYTEDVKYENGTGRLILNSAYEIQWEDNVKDAGADAVFVKGE